MAVKRFVKYPTEILSYDFDFSAWLLARGDTIVENGATAWVDPGLTLVAIVTTGGVVSAFIGGGVSGTQYRVSVQITTTGGRIKRQDIFLRVQGLELPSEGGGGGATEFSLSLDGELLTLDGELLELT